MFYFSNQRGFFHLVGAILPEIASSERHLRLLLRTDFHLILSLPAACIFFCREFNVKMGTEKHHESGKCLASCGKLTFHRIELGI